MRHEINIDSATVTKLRALWKLVTHWMRSANGDNPAYDLPMQRLMARDVARGYLKEYSELIDKLAERDFPKEKDGPKKEPA